MILRVKKYFLILPTTCLGGGTGRRAGFKIQFWQQSAGSIPALGTKTVWSKSLEQETRSKMFFPQ